MLDIHRWADWASRRVSALRAQGFEACFTFTEESRSSDNPSFFVNLDNDSTVGRIVFWSIGDFDVSIHRNLSDEPAAVSGFPAEATDDNFEAIFSRFVESVSE